MKMRDHLLPKDTDRLHRLFWLIQRAAEQDVCRAHALQPFQRLYAVPGVANN